MIVAERKASVVCDNERLCVTVAVLARLLLGLLALEHGLICNKKERGAGWVRRGVWEERTRRSRRQRQRPRTSRRRDGLAARLKQGVAPTQKLLQSVWEGTRMRQRQRRVHCGSAARALVAHRTLVAVLISGLGLPVCFIFSTWRTSEHRGA